MLCFSYVVYPLPVIVRRICLFDNFEKLSMLLGFSGDTLEGWARGCCMHVFLVRFRLFLMVLWQPWISPFPGICRPSLGSTTVQLFKLLRYSITFLTNTEVPYLLKCNALEFKCRRWMLSCFISPQWRWLQNLDIKLFIFWISGFSSLSFLVIISEIIFLVLEWLVDMFWQTSELVFYPSNRELPTY